MREGAGRRSSALDRIRPTVWPAAFTEELLRLLWIIENTVALQPELSHLLEQVIAGETLHGKDLPKPSADERAPPKP